MFFIWKIGLFIVEKCLFVSLVRWVINVGLWFICILKNRDCDLWMFIECVLLVGVLVKCLGKFCL